MGEERSSSHMDHKRKSRWWLWLFLQHVEEDSRTRTREFSRREGCQSGFFMSRHTILQFFHFEILVILSIQS